MADPTALGVFGLSLITLAASTVKLGWTSSTVYVIPWALILGGIAQIWASTADFKRHNYFGSIVLGAYGLFWVAVSFTWMIQAGVFGETMQKADLKGFGWACIAYLVFSVFITVAAWHANKVFGIILTLILVLLAALALQLLGVQPKVTGKIAGVAEFAIAITGLYGTGALFLNAYFGRQVLPMGKGVTWLKRG